MDTDTLREARDRIADTSHDIFMERTLAILLVTEIEQTLKDNKDNPEFRERLGITQADYEMNACGVGLAGSVRIYKEVIEKIAQNACAAVEARCAVENEKLRDLLNAALGGRE